MARLASWETERDCAGLTLKFFQALDSRDYAVCCQCFEEGGAWERQGNVLEGRAAIAEALQQRSISRCTLHVLNNVRVEIMSPVSARVSFILTAFDGESGPGRPDPVARLAGIRDCLDELALTNDGWRIARKRSRGIFRGGP